MASETKSSAEEPRGAARGDICFQSSGLSGEEGHLWKRRLCPKQETQCPIREKGKLGDFLDTDDGLKG